MDLGAVGQVEKAVIASYWEAAVYLVSSLPLSVRKSGTL
jgi:hypothetical protein